MMHKNLWLCNRDEKLLLGIKIASAIVGFMIFIQFIVILIRKLRESHSGSGGVINSQVSIQLPAMNTDDGSVTASAV